MTVRHGVPLVLAAVLVACSGGAGPTTDPLSSRESAAPSAGAGPSSDSDGAASDAPRSTGAGPRVDACALLTDEDIEESVGVPVLSEESASEAQCQWALDDGGSAGPTIFIEVTTPGGRARWEILASQMPAVAVAGGEAYQQGDSISALDGDTMLKLIWLAGTVDQMVPLVEAALTRVGG